MKNVRLNVFPESFFAERTRRGHLVKSFKAKSFIHSCFSVEFCQTFGPLVSSCEAKFSASSNQLAERPQFEIGFDLSNKQEKSRGVAQRRAVSLWREEEAPLDNPDHTDDSDDRGRVRRSRSIGLARTRPNFRMGFVVNPLRHSCDSRLISHSELGFFRADRLA